MQVADLKPGRRTSKEALLKRAFERFNEASGRLEAKYVLLLKETEQLRAELRLKDERIRRAEKLACLGETAAAIAHEVRNPLGAIKLFLSLLRKDVEDRPQAAQLVDEIDRSVTSLNHVVSNILQFSRHEKMDFAPVNIHALLSEQCVHFRTGSASRAQIDLELSGPSFVVGNEHALRTVFYNLLTNSLQATRYQGCVAVSAEPHTAGGVCVTVKDNGPGLPESILDSAFEPFVTARKEGTGLGLAIVRQVVEQHGGEVSCRNDNGAEFKVILPLNANEGNHDAA